MNKIASELEAIEAAEAVQTNIRGRCSEKGKNRCLEDVDAAFAVARVQRVDNLTESVHKVQEEL